MAAVAWHRRNGITAAVAVACGLFAAPLGAEVRGANETGFAVARSAAVKASPAQVYAALVRIGAWWNKAQSWSGDAANLTLDARAGGCFCEALPGGGSAEHMRVVFAQPGRQLRLRGALGLLQGEGVEGALTWTIVAGPQGTRIDQSYVVGGYVRTGMAKLAPLVDAVLGEQLSRLAAYADRADK